jgi:hypothetical protein
MKKAEARALYLFLLLSFLAVPIGLFTENPAWGEWEAGYYQKILGYVPERIRHYSGWYQAPISGYRWPGHGRVLGYYLSALVGITCIFTAFFLLWRLSGGRKD